MVLEVTVLTTQVSQLLAFWYGIDFFFKGFERLVVLFFFFSRWATVKADGTEEVEKWDASLGLTV